MNEVDWLTSTDPIAMIVSLRGAPFTVNRAVPGTGHRWGEPQRGLDRRFRLFSCECCRRIWDRIPEDCNRAAVVAVEELLEGRRTPEEVEAAFRASSAVEAERADEPAYWVVKYLGRGFYKLTAEASAIVIAARIVSLTDGGSGSEAGAARQFQVAALRCLFGNRFRPAPINPNWRTDTATALALWMYESRDYSAMPILADALEETGCDAEGVLAHCREANALHVRGCWVTDLILGKA